MSDEFKWEPIEVPTATPTAVDEFAPIDRGSRTTATDSRRSWLWGLLIAFACMTLFCLVLIIRLLIGGGGDDDSDDREKWQYDPIDGIAVLILEDEDKYPRVEWPQGQTLTMMAVQTWAAKNTMDLDGTQAFAAYDVDQDISAVNPLWTQMRKTVTLDPPCIAVLSGKKFTQFALPDRDEQAIDQLEKAK